MIKKIAIKRDDVSGEYLVERGARPVFPGNGTSAPRPDGGESTPCTICKDIIPERVDSVCTD